MFTKGQFVRFVGREVELGKYHADYAQLMNQVGTVIDVCADFAPYPYTVIFHGFPDSQGFCDYPCRADELQAF